MTSKEIIKQLVEMSLDMDYMDYADYIEDSIDILTNELIKIKNTELYALLENVVDMNGSKELPLLSSMINKNKNT